MTAELCEGPPSPPIEHSGTLVRPQTEAIMQGLMMDYQLTIPAMARRAAALHPHKAIVSRNADGSLHRTTYGETLARSKRLIGALTKLGVRRGDRVATFCWNHHRHLEAYYAVPSMGAVAHMLNIRLQADELAY